MPAEDVVITGDLPNGKAPTPKDQETARVILHVCEELPPTGPRGKTPAGWSAQAVSNALQVFAEAHGADLHVSRGYVTPLLSALVREGHLENLSARPGVRGSASQYRLRDASSTTSEPRTESE